MNYYVSTTGSDSSSGTSPCSAWKTISHATKTVTAAGSTVFIEQGTYNEAVVFLHSGNAGAPITFTNYMDGKVIIDGTGLSPSSGGPKGASGLLQLSNVGFITVKGLEVCNVSSKSDFVAGISVEGKCTQVSLLNNSIHDVSSNKGGGHGIGCYGSSSPVSITGLTISGNTLYNLQLGQSESVVVNGNVDGFSITGNDIHDTNNIGIDAIGYEGTAPAEYDYARNGVISGNTLYNVSVENNPTYPKNDYSADGIYCDGASNVVIERNLCHNCDIGIEIASEHHGRTTSNVIIRNNLVYSCNGAGISLGGYDNSVGSTSGCHIVNNTTFHNDTIGSGSGELMIQYFPASGITSNVVENNIFCAGKQALFMSNPFSKPEVTLNHNLYHALGRYPSWQWSNKTYASLSKFAYATGQDKASLDEDPKFTNTSVPTLSVLPSSPAINAGDNLGPSVVGTADFAGGPRTNGGKIDIGAYELIPSTREGRWCSVS